MADIIPFPQSKSKMIKQINDAERNADFERCINCLMYMNSISTLTRRLH